MRICIAGKNNIAIDICEYIIQKYPKIELFAITNTTDNGIDSWQKSFLRYAKSNSHIQLTCLEQVYELEDLLFLSTEFDTIIKPDYFRTTQLYNIHFSLLPAYKGVYTSVLPILNNEQYSGVTLHCMDTGIDTGNIIAQTRIRIKKNETAFSLYQKYIEKGTLLVIKNIGNLLSGNYISFRQPAKGSSYYSRNIINYEKLSIRLNCTASQIDTQIRAFFFPAYQLPKVYSYYITHTTITRQRSNMKPGSIIENTEEYITLATIDYNIKLYKHNANSLLKFT